MSLTLDIALTHVYTRTRQTLVGTLGVALGVGMSVMMAGLMEGSQRDFISQLVDSLPHITVSDERREPPVQPAEHVYQAVAISNVSTPVIRPGIKNPYAILASMEGWLDGSAAPPSKPRRLSDMRGATPPPTSPELIRAEKFASRNSRPKSGAARWATFIRLRMPSFLATSSRGR
jgi:lipoprotein-releasing system permease protein